MSKRSLGGGDIGSDAVGGGKSGRGGVRPARLRQALLRAAGGVYAAERLEERTLLTTIYVDDSSPAASPTGASWATAYQSLQSALAAAASGDVIRVGAGTYKPTTGTDRTVSFNLKSGVSVMGGYAGYGAGNPEARDVPSFVTTLSGDIGTAGTATDNSYHVVNSPNAVSNSLLDGFTVTGGYGDGTGANGFGGGVYITNSSPTINNCRIVSNRAGAGAGMDVFSSAFPTITNTVFESNVTLTTDGGAIYVAGGSGVTVTGCTFKGNQATSGGAFFINASSATINACLFYANRATTFGGGAIYNFTNANTTISNSVFVGNVVTGGTPNGGAIRNYQAGAVKLINSTVTASQAGNGAGIAAEISVTPMVIVNSIVHGNTGSPNPAQLYASGATFDVSYSDVQGGATGTGNINTTPQFVTVPSIGPDGAWGTADDNYGDLRLKVASPAINAGSNVSAATGADAAGNLRVNDGTVDMGAYEYSLPAVVFAGLQVGVGDFPYSVATGDFNGDGKSDVVSTGSSQVSIVLGRGNGTFSNGTVYSTGIAGQVISVATGDFNGDGFLDLVTANGGGNSVSVLLGRGNGTFAAKGVFAVPGSPYSVAVGDINSDGKLDVVSANSQASNVSVLLGTGDGDLQGAISSTSVIGAQHVALADFNSDGKLDLVTNDQPGGNSLRVQLGSGTGTFAAPVGYFVGSLNGQVRIGDFNGDGKADIVTVLKVSTGRVAVLLGTGTGSFAAAATYLVGANPNSVAVGDINNDGLSDIVTANDNSSGTISVLLGNSSGAFGVAFDYVATTRAYAVAIADLNGDGKSDVVASNYVGGNLGAVSVLLGNGNGTFVAQVDYATDSGPNAVTTGDFDGDGKTDLAVANRVPNSVSVLLATGGGTFVGATHYAVGVSPYSVAVGDLNGDGKSDLVTANYASGTVSVLLGNGNGTFRFHDDYGAGVHPSSVAVGDFNGDGKADLAVSNLSTSGTVSVLLGNGSGAFGAWVMYSVGSSPYSVKSGDFNGDGKSDLAVANYDNDTVSILTGNGNGTFANAVSYAVGAGPLEVSLGDFNADGKMDLVTANEVDDSVSVLLGNGNGTFAMQKSYGAGIAAGSVAVADFNGDGTSDLVTANALSSNLSVLLGNGNGTFALQAVFRAGSTPYSVATGDFNADRKTDLAVANYGSNTVSVLLNASPYTPPNPNFIYVDANAPAGGLNNGTSWANAYKNLYDALSAATAGKSIFIADGTYKPTTGTDRTATFALKSGVAVYGGFAGYGAANPDARDIAVYPTTLSGDIGTVGVTTDNSYHVVTASGVANTGLLDGVIVTGGNANGTGISSYGGGALVSGGAPVFNNCTFSANAATYGGAVLALTSATLTLTGCVFQRNTATLGGGAIYSTSSTINATASRFNGNKAPSGGAVYLFSAATGTFVNSIFAGNAATTSGGGIYVDASALSLVNSTMTANSAVSGGGVSASGSTSTVSVVNSVLWANAAGTNSQLRLTGIGSSSVTYSDIQGGFTGTGNLNADPFFNTPASPGVDGAFGTADDNYGDLSVPYGSPLIDTGSNAAVPSVVTTDIAGNARILGGKVDMGAYESPTQPPDLTVQNVSATPNPVNTGQTVTISWRDANLSGAQAAGTWTDRIVIVNRTTGQTVLNQTVAYTGNAVDAGAFAARTYPWTLPSGSGGIGDYLVTVTVDATGVVAEFNFDGTGETNNSGTTSFTGTLGPVADLVVTNTGYSPASPRTGNVLTITWRDTNSGTLAALGGWRDRVTLVNTTTGQTFTSQFFDQSGVNVAVGGFVTGSVQFQLPDGDAGVGTYSVTIVTDVNGNLAEDNAAGTGETNNTAGLTFGVTIAPYPDLVVTNISVSPASPKTGNLVTVTWRDQNNGTVATQGAWRDRVSLVNLRTGQTIGTQLVDQSGVGAGGFVSGSAQFTLPDGDAGIGDYTVTITADTNGNIYEYNAGGTGESNNTSTATFTGTIAPYADLVVGGLTVTGTSTGAVNIAWNDVNSGNGAATSGWFDRVIVKSLASGATLYDSGNIVVGGGGLAAGSQLPRQASFNLPMGYTAGDLQVTVTVDSGGQVFEYNGGGTGETNNSATTTAAFPLADYPDLVVTGLSISPASPRSGNQVTVSWTDFNSGLGTAGFDWYDRVVVKNSATGATLFDSGYSVLGTAGLATGTGAGRSVSFKLPDGPTGVGNWVVTVTVDGTERLFEYNAAGTAETNNTAMSPFTSTLNDYPDLTVTGVSVSPVAPKTSNVVTVSWYDRNTGNSPATGSWYDAIALVNTTTGRQVGVVTNLYSGNDLAPGAQVLRTQTFTLPDGPDGVGTYTATIVTDYQSQVFEYNAGGTGETNNQTLYSFVATLGEYADISVTPARPVDVLSGRPVDLSWTVGNGGTARTTGTWIDYVYVTPAAGGADIYVGQFESPKNLNPGESYTRVTPWTPRIDLSGQFRVKVISSNVGFYELNTANNTGLSSAFNVILAPYPDLQVNTITGPTSGSVTAGENLSITWTVINRGNGTTDASAWYDYVYFTKDGVTTRIGRVANPTFLQPGESYQQSLTYPLSTKISGNYAVYVVTNAEGQQYEYTYGNNNKSADVAVQIAPISNPARFKVTNVQVAPAFPTNAYAGSVIYVTYTVINDGGERITGSWSDLIALSPTPTYDDQASTNLSLVPVSGVTELRSGDTYRINAYVTLPALISGTFYVYIDVDHNLTASETDGKGPGDVAKSGGSAAVNVIFPPLPNLQVTSITPPATADAGTPATVRWTVLNNGFAPTGTSSWNDRVYLSTSATLTAADLPSAAIWGTQVRSGGLNGADSYNGQGTFTVPINLAGDYYVYVLSDVNGQVTYNDPRSAHFARSTGVVRINAYAGNGNSGGGGNPDQPLPSDLQPLINLAPTSALSGNSYSVFWTVRNNGPYSTAASIWTDEVYISDSGSLTSGHKILVASVVRNGALGVGQGYSGSATFSLPEYARGTWYVLVVTNSNGVVAEGAGNSANNIASSSFPVTARPTAALQVSDFTVPARITSDQPTQISWRIWNNGTAATLASEKFWTDTVYLTTNGVVTQQSPVLASVQHEGPLAVGADYAVQVGVRLPLGISGPYTLVLVSDSSPSVYQGQTRTGDTAARAVTVDPAPYAVLAVDSITADASAYAGQNVTIRWTALNRSAATGPTNVSSWVDSVFLSKDQFYSPASIPLGPALHTGAVSAGGSYTNSLTVPLPSYLSGPYFIIVQLDSGARVYQAGNTGENVGASVSTIAVSVPPLTDLSVVSVTGPATGVAGRSPSTPITWTVRNLSVSSAFGAWTDSVYLSRDGAFDATDILIDSVPHVGGLAAGASYTAQTNAVFPAVAIIPPPGGYYLLVRTDTRGVVPEAQTNRANNTGISGGVISMDVPSLLNNVPTTGIINPGQLLSFRVTTDAGQQLKIEANFAKGYEARFYVRYGQPATVSQYDQVYTQPADKTATISVPNTTAGNYYILLEGKSGAIGGANFSLKASVPAFSVTGVDQSAVGNTGTVTLTVSGVMFTPTARVSLVKGLASRNASSVIWRDESTLWATFDMAGAEAGNYSVRVSQTATDGSLVTATYATPVAVAATTPGQLQVRVGAPGVLRKGTTGQVTFFYENIGTTDVPAPLLLLEADGAEIRTPDGGEVKSLQVLGINRSGPAGVLPAGYKGSITYTVTLNAFDEKGANTYSFRARPLGDLSQVIDWSAIKASSRPSYISTAAWDGIWQNFISAAGSTVGQVQSALGATASYLSQLNRYTGDLGDLFGFLYTQADAGIVRDTPAVTSDISVASAGVPLAVTRTFSPTISGRNQLGLFGTGWQTPWEARLVTGADGQRIVNLATGQIPFAKSGTAYVGPTAAGSLVSSTSEFRYTDPTGTVYAFNSSSGQLTSVRDRNGNQVGVSYFNGRITTLTHSDGSSLTFTYNAGGRVTAIASSTGQIVSYVYDASGERLLSGIGPRGTTAYTYDTGANVATVNALLSVTRPDGSHLYYQYDASGRRTASGDDIAPQGNRYSYGTGGTVSVTDAAGGVTTTLLNDALRPGRTIDARGNVTRLDYDAAGNLITEVQPGGFVYRYTYDAVGRLTGLTDPQGSATSFTYNTAGRLTQVRDAKGDPVVYTYDSRGNTTAVTFADGKSQTYTYDTRGLAAVFTNARGDSVNYTYDTSGRPATVTLPGGGGVNRYAYDAAGNLTQTVDATGTTSYTYDSAGRLLSVVSPGGRSLTYTYDVRGRRSSMTDQSGFVIRYEYDAAGRMTAVRDIANATVSLYQYDATGRMLSQVNGNGSFTVYSYDGAGNVVSQTNYAADNTVTSSFQYTYDARGRRTSAVTADGVWQYTYDTLGQVTAATFGSTSMSVPSQTLVYNHDIVGNRTSTVINGQSKVYIADSRDRYTSVGSVAFTYDFDGNLTSDGTASYGYDALGRLVSVTPSGGTPATTYTYDASGRRASQTASGQTTTFQYDPVSGRTAAESSGGSMVRTVVGASGVPTARDVAGSRSYFDYDASGNVVAVTSPDGVVAARFAYNPFGQVFATSGSADGSVRFAGAGGATTGPTGLVFDGTRDLNPLIGRTQSPGVGLLGGDIGLYRFAGNQWVNLGLKTLPAASVFAAVALQNVATQNFPGMFSLVSSLSAGQADGSVRIGRILGGFADYLQPGAQPPEFFAGIGVPSAGLAASILPKVLTGKDASSTVVGKSSYRGQAGTAQGQQSTSLDPNSILGPQGYGATRLVGLAQPLPYRIDFENVKEATSPAQVVTVEQSLDPNLDWRTFTLKTIVFNHHEIKVPDGYSFYSTFVDLRPFGQNLLAYVSAGIDVTLDDKGSPLSAGITLKLVSINPDSGETPTDPNVGLLPVNNADGDGQGYLSYTIRARDDRPTGTVINAQAAVTFDTQPPLQTDIWTNTLDAVAPSATVTALPANVPGRRFDVSWSGQDDDGGAGVAAYNIFVSTNGGPFLPWLVGTTLTRAQFLGENGRVYSFAATAIDNAGNAGPLPQSAQTATAVGFTTVVNRGMVYNNSAFDGFDPAANAADDAALAPNKSALLPGQPATFANYSNFTRGLNSIVMDLTGLDGRLVTASDFTFKVGNTATPDTWAASPAPRAIVIRRGAGVGASDRVEIIWDDNAIRNQWLQVTVKANANTGLARPDVFYFGHEAGDTGLGNLPTRAIVNATDASAIRSRYTNSADITSDWDLNRDGKVDVADFTYAQANGTTFATGLLLFTPPATSAAKPVKGSAGSDGGALVTGSVNLLAGVFCRTQVADSATRDLLVSTGVGAASSATVLG